MKQEVTRLQEMLNRLDFKRKVCVCIIMCKAYMWGTQCLYIFICIYNYLSQATMTVPHRRSCQRWTLWSKRLMTWWPLSSTQSCRTGNAGSRSPPLVGRCSLAWTNCRAGKELNLSWNMCFYLSLVELWPVIPTCSICTVQWVSRSEHLRVIPVIEWWLNFKVWGAVIHRLKKSSWNQSSRGWLKL